MTSGFGADLLRVPSAILSSWSKTRIRRQRSITTCMLVRSGECRSPGETLRIRSMSWVDSFVPQPGGGLIQKEQSGAQGQGPGDFQTLLDSPGGGSWPDARQRTGSRPPGSGSWPPGDFLLPVGASGLPERGVEQLAQGHQHIGLHVLGSGKGGPIGKVPADSLPADLVGLRFEYRLSLKRDLARNWAGRFPNEVKKSVFPGSIGSDDSQNLGRLSRKKLTPSRAASPSNSFAQRSHLQQRHGNHLVEEGP